MYLWFAGSSYDDEDDDYDDVDVVVDSQTRLEQTTGVQTYLSAHNAHTPIHAVCPFAVIVRTASQLSMLPPVTNYS